MIDNFYGAVAVYNGELLYTVASSGGDISLLNTEYRLASQTERRIVIRRTS